LDGRFYPVPQNQGSAPRRGRYTFVSRRTLWNAGGLSESSEGGGGKTGRRTLSFAGGRGPPHPCGGRQEGIAMTQPALAIGCAAGFGGDRTDSADAIVETLIA